MLNFERLIFARYANLINKNGGLTLDRAGQVVECKTGYMVSICGVTDRADCLAENSNHTRVYGALVEGAISQIVCNRPILSSLFYIGFWSDNGTLYTDITVNVKSKKIALIIGFLCKQKAIYDCKRQKVISF